MIKEVPCPDDVLVYDRQARDATGEFIHLDRFTVFMPDGAVYTMSTNACSPIGICRYAGTDVQVKSTLSKEDVIRDTIPVHVFRQIQSLRV